MCKQHCTGHTLICISFFFVYCRNSSTSVTICSCFCYDFIALSLGTGQWQVKKWLLCFGGEFVHKISFLLKNRERKEHLYRHVTPKKMHLTKAITIHTRVTNQQWQRMNTMHKTVRPYMHVLFFLCFSSPARVAFGWKLKKKTMSKSNKNSCWFGVAAMTLACCTCRLAVEWTLQFLHGFCEEEG